MGKEQGDELPKNPTIYVGTVDGETQERAAYGRVDEVNLAARGWVPKSEKHDGKRAPAASSPSPRVEQASTGNGTA